MALPSKREQRALARRHVEVGIIVERQIWQEVKRPPVKWGMTLLCLAISVGSGFWVKAMLQEAPLLSTLHQYPPPKDALGGLVWLLFMATDAYGVFMLGAAMVFCVLGFIGFIGFVARARWVE